MRAITALLSIACAGISSSLVVLDDFTSGPYSKTILSGSSLDFVNGSMAGGDRGIDMEVQANPLAQKLTFTVDTSAGLIVNSSGTLMDGKVTLMYGYEPVGNATIIDPLDFNAMSQSRFELNFATNDLPLLVTVKLDSDAFLGNHATQTVAYVVPASQTAFTFDILFADFNLIDFSDLDSISIDFDMAPSGDFVLGGLNAVPEPATMVAVGLGMAAVVRYRRKMVK